jgi:hypothetical protein
MQDLLTTLLTKYPSEFKPPVPDDDICKDETTFGDYVILQGFYKTTDSTTEAYGMEMLKRDGFEILQSLKPLVFINVLGEYRLEPDFNMFYNQLAFYLGTRSMALRLVSTVSRPRLRSLPASYSLEQLSQSP